MKVFARKKEKREIFQKKKQASHFEKQLD